MMRNAIDHAKRYIHLLVNHVNCMINFEDVKKIDHVIMSNEMLMIRLQINGRLSFLDGH